MCDFYFLKDFLVNKLSSIFSLVSIVLATATLSTAALAQAATAAPATTASATLPAKAMPVKDMSEAEVRKVDKEAKKVTLKHGPIKNLDMPGMTMVFQVRDAALFDKLAVGEKIMFTAEQLQGAYVVTGVEKAESK
jgi:Cu(I)/Ag(I) efflux system periplasmic protein CusF